MTSANYLDVLSGTSMTVTLRALNPNSAASASTPTGWTSGNSQNISGHFATDTDFVSSIKFLNAPGAKLIEGIDSVLFSPLSDGSEPGTASADFATRLYIGSGALIGGWNMELAFRNVLYDISSGAIAISSGAFASNSVSIGTLSENLAYKSRSPFGLGGATFVGLFGSGSATNVEGTSTNSVGAADGSISLTPKVGGDVATLFLPFNIPITYALDSAGLLNLKMNLTGTLVATAIVPEPATYALLTIGMSCLVPAVLSKWRRRTHSTARR